jgi:uncharacterized protein YecE (DUF72 family)
LFQFPYSFHYTPENRRYLADLLAAFEGVPSAVEFRNSEWINDGVIGGLRERGAALTALDMPDLKGLPPTLDTVTAPFGYFRLHGRNKGAWWGSDAAARYDYLYTDRELEAADRVRSRYGMGAVTKGVALGVMGKQIGHYDDVPVSSGLLL